MPHMSVGTLFWRLRAAYSTNTGATERVQVKCSAAPFNALAVGVHSTNYGKPPYKCMDCNELSDKKTNTTAPLKLLPTTY